MKTYGLFTTKETIPQAVEKVGQLCGDKIVLGSILDAYDEMEPTVSKSFLFQCIKNADNYTGSCKKVQVDSWEIYARRLSADVQNKCFHTVDVYIVPKNYIDEISKRLHFSCKELPCLVKMEPLCIVIEG